MRMYLKYGPKCCTSGDLKTVTVMLEKRFKNVKKKCQEEF